MDNQNSNIQLETLLRKAIGQAILEVRSELNQKNCVGYNCRNRSFFVR